MIKHRLFGLYLAVSVLAMLFFGWQESLAIPAAPITFNLTQPNDTTFKARNVGDEWNHWTVTQTGYTTLLDEASGYWVYAQKDQDGNLKSSTLKVGIDAPKGIEKGLKPMLKPVPRITPSPRAPGQSGSHVYAPPVGASGEQPVLVILVEFLDRALIITDHSAWNASFFAGSSSIKDYYNEVSYGALELVPATETYNVVNDGVVAVKLDYTHPGDAGSRQTTYDALTEADSDVDFSQFDTDLNGYISTNELHIVIVAAGFEGAFGNCTPNVWAHHWNLESGVSLDGVTVGADNVGGDRYYGGYVQIGELHYADSCDFPYMATIGVMAHELGHDLWLPDMYDVDGSSEGIGDWGIMGGGAWGFVSLPGDSPAHPSPWDRWYEGWLTPIEVSDTTTVPIPEVETSATVYQLVSNPSGVDWSFYGSSGTGEYFLVENRQQTGYDVGLPACGILIWNINESVVEDNTCNQHEWGARLVAVEQADGSFDLENDINRGDGGDPYLAGDTFDADTLPNSNFYDGSPSGVSISIADGCGANMTATLSLCELDIYYRDADEDTYGNPHDPIQACVGLPPVGYVSNNQDCNDNDDTIYPGATEDCNGMDDDCNGEIDEGFPTSTYYRDADGDTYGDPATTTQACIEPSGYVSNNQDCNDTNASIHPGASEVCDGLDNDCDGVTDEGSPTFTYYRDADDDTYGDPNVSTQACTEPSGYVSNNTDCDDTNPRVNPGETEVCDGLDNDCNGVKDDGDLDNNDGDELCDGVDPDDDNDGLPDTWELSNGLDPLDATGNNGADGDPDGDGFTNLQEYERDWDPQHASTTWYADVGNTSGIEDGSATNPYNTITEAIDAAFDGDTVFVDTGTYREVINFNGKTLVIMAEAGDEGTTIDATLYLFTPVVTFENGEGPYAELSGFIITNGGYNGYLPSQGGGIAVLNDSSPRIVNNIITNNNANYGGAITCNNSSPTIINNTIVNNWASAVGGGIYCIGNSSPTVTNTILWNNGDEIYLDESTITVTYSDVDGGYEGLTNIDLNPLFVGSGDYHLQADSPCIDAGTGSDAPVDDIDGDSRPQLSGYDIGADEYSSEDCTDDDNDGYAIEGGECGPIDCDDTDPATNPGKSEVCDGVDNNCNEEIDEDCGEGEVGDGGGGGGGSGGCFIATAAYGTSMAGQVIILCRFRDQCLLPNIWGRKFVELYYKYSQPAANYIADKDLLRLVVRICLAPVLLIALFMVKLGLLGKLLAVSSLIGLPIAWRRLNQG